MSETYSLKGFIALPSLTNNAAGSVALLGEISKDSLTYTKETGMYKSTTYPDALLYSFNSISSESGAVSVPTDKSEIALRVGTFFLNAGMNGIFNGNASHVSSEINLEFDSLIENIEVGILIQMPFAGSYNDEIWMPEWINFKLIGEDSTFRLWFSDSSFLTQYDGFEYSFIPPIENIDDFFRSKAEVAGLIAENGMAEIISRIEGVREEYPYTLIKTKTYEWLDSIDPLFKLNTSWTTLVYGRAGNDPEQIRLSLVEWILANSVHSREEWLELLPDLFTPSEFILVPLFNQFAVPNETIQAGLNSPVITLVDAKEVAVQLCRGVGFEEEFLLANTSIAATPYTPLGMVVVGNEMNRGGIKTFYAMFPDYIGLPISSLDFGRLSVRTQNWIRMFVDLIEVARDMSEYNVVPPGFSRITRDDIIYVSKEFENMQYIVASKISIEAKLGIIAP